MEEPIVLTTISDPQIKTEPAIVIKEKISPREKTGVTTILVEQAKVFKEGRLVSSSPSCSSSSGN